jgi:DMSO/TMAO reductase YedYZ molybdopterin-dependent catalytic subunit
MSRIVVQRRKFLGFGALAVGAAALGFSGRLSAVPSFEELIASAQGLTYGAQRLLGGRRSMAREFSEADLSPDFKVNGTEQPGTPEYEALLAEDFVNWKLLVEGLVVKRLALSLADLRSLPQRAQITRHDCVEGWSAIGKWQGPPLAEILQRAIPLPAARFVVLHCADYLEHAADGTGRYYESIDLIDAFHPQTILAHGLNGAPLSVGHGAPLRLRVERQLGYKQAKFVMRVELVDRLDKSGYEWYAGI